MRLGKTTGQAICAFSKGVKEVAVVPNVSRLGGQVIWDVVVKVTFVSKGAFPVRLQQKYCYDNNYQFGQKLK